MTDERLVEVMVDAAVKRLHTGTRFDHIFREAKAQDMRAALSALRGAGFAVVPEEPTEAMLAAADAEDDRAAADNFGVSARAEVHWYAMIDAAQAQSEVDRG